MTWLTRAAAGLAALLLVCAPAYAQVAYTTTANGARITVPVTPSAPLPVTVGSTATPAGENHLGQVGGLGVVSTADPTVTASSAYTSGNWVGGLLTFPNVVRTGGPGSAILQTVTIQFKSAQTAATDFAWCNTNPTNTTITDKTAASLAVADFAKCRVIHVSDCTSLGTPTTCTTDGVATPVVIPSGTTGYGFLVTRGTPTFTATSDVEVQLRILQD